MRITIVVGPGFYGQYLIEELARKRLVGRVIRYWPEFEVWRGEEDGVLTREVQLTWYRRFTWLIWAMWRRLPQLRRYQTPSALLNAAGDCLATRYVSECDILWGWSQVSLRCLLKARKIGATTILEHPMVHVDRWMEVMRQEYRNHDVSPESYYSLFPRLLTRRMRKEYEAVDILNVSSSFAARSFSECGVGGKKVVVTPLTCVDPHVFHPEPGGETKRFRVLYVGRISLEKGVRYLLQAFSELRLPDAELWLVGPVLPEMASCLARYKGSFRYLGELRHEELPDIYRQASVFVLPSIQEGFGLVVVEAMASGVPVIATENTGGPDVIREGVDGFVVPARDAAILGKRILWCYAHQGTAREMGIAAREHVVSELTVSHYGARLLGVTRSVRGR